MPNSLSLLCASAVIQLVLIAALVASAAFNSSSVHAAAPPLGRHVATPAASRAALPPTTLDQAPAGLRAAVTDRVDMFVDQFIAAFRSVNPK